MYRSLTYLLKNGALPWADRSLTCQLKNRQVSSLTGLIAQIPCNSHHRVLTEEGPGFKVIKKLHWAVVGELPFLNRRWLLAGHLCHFSVPLTYPVSCPSFMSCFVWANGKVSGSGTIIFYICIHRVLVLIWEHHVLTLKVYVIDLSGVWEDCREKIEGFGVSKCGCAGDTEGLESVAFPKTGPPLQAKLGPMILNCKSHLGFASLSAPLLLPAAEWPKHSCLHSYQYPCSTLFISVSYTCRHIESFAHNCQVTKTFCFAL